MTESRARISKAFGGLKVGEEKKSGGMLEKVVGVNKLKYSFHTDLSAVTTRTHKKYFADQASYAAESTAIIELGSSSDYVWGRGSSLVFSVAQVGGNAVASFGGATTGAYSLIRNVIITSRGGKELSRINNFNVYATIMDRMTKPTDYYTANGHQGYGTGVLPLDNSAVWFSLELSKIPFFNSDMLIPPTLASGLRIRLELESHAIAINTAAGAGTSYTVAGMYAFLDSLSLIDSVSKSLLQQASRTGLEYEYMDVSNTRNGYTTADTSIRIDNRRSISRGHMVFTVARLAGVLAKTADSFTIAAFNAANTTQYRIGSLYLPHATTSNVAERYGLLLEAVQKPDMSGRRDLRNPSLDYATYLTTTGAVIAQTLARSNTLELSSVPINNSRTLSLDATITALSDASTWDMFLVHEKRVKSFINNTIVEE